MPEALKVDIAFTTDNRWVAEVEPDFDQPLEQSSLIELINSVREARPDDNLIFIVDTDSIQGHLTAQTEFRDAARTSGLPIKESRKAFNSDTSAP